MARVTEFLYPLPAGIGRLLRLDRLAEPWTITADRVARVLSVLGTPAYLARVARSNPRDFIRLLRHLPLAIVVGLLWHLDAVYPGVSRALNGAAGKSAGDQAADLHRRRLAFVRRLVINSRAHDEHFRLAAIMGLAQYSGMENDAPNPFE